MSNEKRLTADLDAIIQDLWNRTDDIGHTRILALKAELAQRTQDRDALYSRLVRDACACEHDGNVVKDPCQAHLEWKEAEVTTLSRRLQLAEDPSHDMTVTIKNLRFYADMARQFKWQTDVIHSSVIEVTLREIADRLAIREPEVGK